MKRDFTHLLGTLTGISDRSLRSHLELYGGYVDTLTAIEKAQPLIGPANNGQEGLPAQFNNTPILQVPVAQLDLKPLGPLVDALAVVKREFDTRGLNPATWPTFTLGEETFATQLGTVAINVPWFLANPTLWQLANQAKSNRYTFNEVLKTLRHELGHALFFAHDLGRIPEWVNLFGDPAQPYTQSYTSDPNSEAHVSYTTGLTDHYGQKHPEEDWAETFARWLDSDGGWEEQYKEWPQALEKLYFVQAISELFKQAPPRINKGRLPGYKSFGSQTVADRLGLPRLIQPFSGHGWNEHQELMRRHPAALNEVLLHELYFEGLSKYPPFTNNFNGNTPPLLSDLSEGVTKCVKNGFFSENNYRQNLRQLSGGVFWALSTYDLRAKKVRNIGLNTPSEGVPVDNVVLLAIDCCEHAYAQDYGNRKDLYIAAVEKNINWKVFEHRLLTAAPYLGGQQELPSLWSPEQDDNQTDDLLEAFDQELSPEAVTNIVTRFAAKEGPVRKGTEGKVAVQRTVMHADGKSHKQVYWVHPKDLHPDDVKIGGLPEGGGQPELSSKTITNYKWIIKQALLGGMEAPPQILAKLGVAHVDDLEFGVLKPKVPKTAPKAPPGDVPAPAAASVPKPEPKPTEAPVAPKTPEPVAAPLPTDATGNTVAALQSVAQAYLNANAGATKGEALFAAHLAVHGVGKQHHDWWIKDFKKNNATMTDAKAAVMGWNAVVKKNPDLPKVLHGFQETPKAASPAAPEKPLAPKPKDALTLSLEKEYGAPTEKAVASHNKWMESQKEKHAAEAAANAASLAKATAAEMAKKPSFMVSANLPPEPKNLEAAHAAYNKVAVSGSANILRTFGDIDYQRTQQALQSWQSSQVKYSACELRFGACSLLAKWQNRDIAHVAKMERLGINLSDQHALGKPEGDVLDKMQAAVGPGHHYETSVKALARASQAAHADGPEWITVYRGMKNTDANRTMMENAVSHGKVPSNGMTSFATTEASARSVGGPIVYQTKIHRSQIAVSHKAFPNLLGGEHEIIAFTNNHFVAEQIKTSDYIKIPGAAKPTNYLGKPSLLEKNKTEHKTGKSAKKHGDWDTNTNVFEARKKGPE